MTDQHSVAVASDLAAFPQQQAHKTKLHESSFVTQDISSLTLVKALHEQFTTAKPFPHIVFHGLFAAPLLDRVLQDFGSTSFGDWLRYDSASEVKWATRPGAKLGPASQDYIDVVHRGSFINFLSNVSGIPGLLPDPTLFGGGLHEIPNGGYFAVHTDFNKHPTTELNTRLVLITYLNRDWDVAYGGALEFWDGETNRCVERVIPRFGDTVLFAHGAGSLHGHPDPVRTPDGRTRRSIATYYYTNGQVDGLNKETIRTTRFHMPMASGRWGRVANATKYFLPPILIDSAKKIRRSIHRT